MILTSNSLKLTSPYLMKYLLNSLRIILCLQKMHEITNEYNTVNKSNKSILMSFLYFKNISHCEQKL